MRQVSERIPVRFGLFKYAPAKRLWAVERQPLLASRGTKNAVYDLVAPWIVGITTELLVLLSSPSSACLPTVPFSIVSARRA